MILVILLACSLSESIPATSTLIVAVPTRDGMVVAADSRTTVAGEYFDGVEKLVIAAGKPRRLFSITGTSDFVDAPPPEVSIRDWMPSAPYRFRGNDHVGRYLEANPSAMDESYLMALGRNLATAFSAYFGQNPLAGEKFRGRELCQVVLFESQRKPNQLLVGSVLITVDAAGNPQAARSTVFRYRQDGERDLVLLGEDEYARSVVFDAHRSSPLEPLTRWQSQRMIRDLDWRDGLSVAASVIDATAAATEVTPVPSGNGVGGPVRAYLVTSGRIRPLLATESKSRPRAPGERQ